MNLTDGLDWCRRHRRLAGGIAIVALHFIGFRVYYCVAEGCTHPANWWFHLPDESQAAWIEALGALSAVWWGGFLFWTERLEKQAIQRKLAEPRIRTLCGDGRVIELVGASQSEQVTSGRRSWLDSPCS